MKNFKGIYPALLTPFDKDGNVNVAELEKLIKMNIEKGVAGFYVCGSTAEAFLLSEEERMLVYKVVKNACPDNIVLIAHIGDISTEKALKFGKYAEELGYDAVSSIAPFYYKFSVAEIKKYYTTIADTINLPLILYNFPAFSGVELSFDDISELLKHENIIGVKHTSSDYFKLQMMKSAFPDKYFFNGYDEMCACGLISGADGAIGSTFNFMAEKFVAMKKEFDNGNIAKVQKIQNDANIIISALCKVGVMQGEKAMLDLMGFDFGICREPFGQLDENQIKYLKETIMPLL